MFVKQNIIDGLCSVLSSYALCTSLLDCLHSSAALSRYGSSTCVMYLNTSTSTLTFARSTYLSQNTSRYKCFYEKKYFEHFIKYSQVHYKDATFMFYNGESQTDESAKASALCIYSLFQLKRNS